MESNEVLMLRGVNVDFWCNILERMILCSFLVCRTSRNLCSLKLIRAWAECDIVSQTVNVKALD